jgi:hypothetical protein
MALADLYIVTLGMREHKMVFTKDVPKVTSAEADEASQYMQRAPWRFRDMGRDACWLQLSVELQTSELS